MQAQQGLFHIRAGTAGRLTGDRPTTGSTASKPMGVDTLQIFPSEEGGVSGSLFPGLLGHRSKFITRGSRSAVHWG